MPENGRVGEDHAVAAAARTVAGRAGRVDAVAVTTFVTARDERERREEQELVHRDLLEERHEAGAAGLTGARDHGPEPSTMLQSMLQQSPFACSSGRRWRSSSCRCPTPPHVPNVLARREDAGLTVAAVRGRGALRCPSGTQPPPQWSMPFWSGTHGAPLQQSPANAHVSPVHLAARAEAVAARHAERVELADAGVARAAAAVVTRDRVVARRVVLVVADVALGIARLRVAADAGRIGRVILEADDVAVAGQAGAAAPQQSLSCAAEIAVDAAALGGLADLHAGRRVGSHRRQQQSPQPLHTVPSTPAWQFVLPGIGCEQGRCVSPGTMLQMPPQHSPSCAHASPSCTQYEDVPQWPFASHSFEQQSPFAAHALPSVLQLALSGAHVPLGARAAAALAVGRARRAVGGALRVGARRC